MTFCYEETSHITQSENWKCQTVNKCLDLTIGAMDMLPPPTLQLQASIDPAAGISLLCNKCINEFCTTCATWSPPMRQPANSQISNAGLAKNELLTQQSVVD
jgi:hypothetical protein